VTASVGAVVASAIAVLVVTMFSVSEEVVTITDGVNTTTARSGTPWSAMAIIVAVLIATFGVVVLAQLRRGNSSAAVIGAIADLSAVGAFAEALYHEDRYVRTEAEEALIAMLPRMKPGDAGLLNDKQRACLHRTLKPPRRAREADLAMAVIGACTEIADPRAVPHVARLADEAARGALQERVRAHAAERLPLLKARVEAARLAQTLVRPASAPDGALLRPVEAAPSGPTEHLVRPASGP
jgi:hypothetical protein